MLKTWGKCGPLGSLVTGVGNSEWTIASECSDGHVLRLTVKVVVIPGAAPIVVFQGIHHLNHYIPTQVSLVILS